MTSKEYCLSEKVTQKISPNVQKCVKNILKSEGFLTYDVIVKDISPDGGNYLGILQEVDIKGTTETGEKEINLFLKNSIPSESFTMLPISEVYSREAYVYNELFKIFDKFQDEANVPKEERFKSVKSYGESNSEVLILENVSKKGYKTYNRSSTISMEFAVKSVKQLAKFHALTAVLHNKDPNYFHCHIKNLGTLLSFDHTWEKFVYKNCERTVEYLDDKSKQKIADYGPIMVEKLKRYFSPLETNGDFLCHGDFRANNIMNKEINGELLDVIPVDYQLIFHGSFILDFFYFIFTATDQKFRKEHMDTLKMLYYDTMDSFMRYFDVHIEDVYPKKKFEVDYKEKMDYGLMSFLMLSPFLFATNDNVPVLDDHITELKFNMDDNYKKRLQGVVDDFIRWGYL